MMTIERTLSGGFDVRTGLNVLDAYPLNGKEQFCFLIPSRRESCRVKDANLSGL